MSLPRQWRELATPLMRYGVRFIDIGHMGHSRRQKYRDGDEDDRASEREWLASAPALGERCHRSLARRLVAKGRRAALVFVRCPHPGSVLRCVRRQEYPPYYDAVLHDVVVVMPPSPETAQGSAALRISGCMGLATKPDEQTNNN